MTSIRSGFARFSCLGTGHWVVTRKTLGNNELCGPYCRKIRWHTKPNLQSREISFLPMHGCRNYTVRRNSSLHCISSSKLTTLHENSWSHFMVPTLSEETAQPIVYHQLSQVSVDMQLSGLIKCREDSDVLMQMTQLIFRPLSWVLPESAA